MICSIHTQINDVKAHEWNRLADTGNPFVKHEFLSALEKHGCVGAVTGWFPCHIIVRDEGGLIVGVMPMYIKNNSYGEFVFDWSWADAYDRNGLEYYPKLVIGIPFTPATGARFFYDSNCKYANELPKEMIRHAIAFAQENQMSSVHWLFPTAEQLNILVEEKMLARLGCQYHWHNAGYNNFDEFLQTFTAVKRKKVKQDRRRVRDANIELEVLEGSQIDDRHWEIFHEFYSVTFDKKGGIATLTLDFFKNLSKTMPQNIVMILARHKFDYVAAALNFRGSDTLYGRHWGSNDQYKGLHFEACYYQGIEYCIKHGLKRFEPGAQGEYKISRGFRPTSTWSAHWIAHSGFHNAIANFVDEERRFMMQQINELTSHIPYKAVLQVPDP